MDIEFENKVREKLSIIERLLIEKNKAYGNSALNPAKVFSKLDSIESILIRIDDKLKRIQNKGLDANTEDTVQDLVGYLVLLMIARDERNNSKEPIREGQDLPHTSDGSVEENQGWEFYETYWSTA
tara:strand:+ start:243 stop:620 length:378 start_codon:yes stop_codon:yes gene_type:complete